LCSRSGSAQVLQQELEQAGASVTVAGCDVAKRDHVERLLAEIPHAHPLTAVFHTAGVVDDGLWESQSPERLARVFAPKVVGAWHLHELTRGLPLDAFVMFSSVSGVLGGAGQSNYAAANVFLDALAHARYASGLAATSLDWGLWQERSGVTAHLTQADMQRMARSGMLALSSEQALSMLDCVLGTSQPQLVTNRFDPRISQVPADQLPGMLKGLGSRQLRRAGSASAQSAEAFKTQLAQLDAREREHHILRTVSDAVRTVLGVTTVEPDRQLTEAGLDSLTAVELRNYLAKTSGLRLASTLLFDYPTPTKLARHLHERLVSELPRAHAPVFAELTRLEDMLANLAFDNGVHAELHDRLRALLRRIEPPVVAEIADADVEVQLESIDDDELYRVIENTLSE